MRSRVAGLLGIAAIVASACVEEAGQAGSTAPVTAQATTSVDTTRSSSGVEQWRCNDATLRQHMRTEVDKLLAANEARYGYDGLFERNQRDWRLLWVRELNRAQEVCGDQRYASEIRVYNQQLAGQSGNTAVAGNSASDVAALIGATAGLISTVRGGSAAPAAIVAPIAAAPAVQGQRAGGTIAGPAGSSRASDNAAPVTARPAADASRCFRVGQDGNNAFLQNTCNAPIIVQWRNPDECRNGCNTGQMNPGRRSANRASITGSVSFEACFWDDWSRQACRL